MKTSFIGLGLIMGFALLHFAIFRSPSYRTIPSGTIQLHILNPSCAKLSPESDDSLFLTAEHLNDGELDAFEIQAIDEGCTLEASAIAPNGMRLTDIPLLLIRSDPTTYVPETFGGPRRTDDYGTATWTFQLVPNTDFIYQVISPHPVGKTVGSNPMEIELCTGVRSENAFPQVRSPDVGRGCR